MSPESFSFKELRETAGIAPATPGSLTGTDGIRLSFRCYAPPAPCATLLFYHGGGAHSGAGYQHFGQGLKSRFDVAVFMPDIRGHGDSGGPRGDAPSPKQVWTDVTTFIKYIRATYPHLPVFLGGHSSGAGLTLNYSHEPDHEMVQGYVFLSPQLGFRSQTERPSLEAQFAVVNPAPFSANAASGGLVQGHDYAVRLNYPPDVLARDPHLVTAYTVNMSNALTPSAPREQFAALDSPFGLWIGEEDELMLPEKVLVFGNLAISAHPKSQMGSIPAAKHLSILINAHERVGPWITGMIG